MRSMRSGALASRTVKKPQTDGRYEVRLADTPVEVAAALRLRHRVFNVELGGEADEAGAIEFDEFDLDCRHLIVICRDTGGTVGTYRLNTAETASVRTGFYSAREFTTEHLPKEVLLNGVEIGRACIDRDHRNTRVLFLLWKGLIQFLEASQKQFFFGCCSMFTRDELVGARAYRKLEQAGHLSSRFRVLPRGDAVDIEGGPAGTNVEIPSLFDMYLRLGAEVCSPPMVDRDFGTIDFFVVFDVERMTDKYRRMFAR